QTERLDSRPDQSNVSDVGQNLAPEENLALIFRQYDEAHRPRKHAKKHAQAEPPQNLDCAAKFSRVKKRDGQRREAEDSKNGRPSHKESHFELFVDQAIAFFLLVSD